MPRIVELCADFSIHNFSIHSSSARTNPDRRCQIAKQQDRSDANDARRVVLALRNTDMLGATVTGSYAVAVAGVVVLFMR